MGVGRPRGREELVVAVLDDLGPGIRGITLGLFWGHKITRGGGSLAALVCVCVCGQHGGRIQTTVSSVDEFVIVSLPRGIYFDRTNVACLSTK